MFRLCGSPKDSIKNIPLNASLAKQNQPQNVRQYYLTAMNKKFLLRFMNSLKFTYSSFNNIPFKAIRLKQIFSKNVLARMYSSLCLSNHF